jgi:hypothetical protein
MYPIQLRYTTGHPQIDHILCGVIGIFETAFPDRVRSYYLVGSYASDAAGPLSDIDLRVIFKGEFASGEEEKMRQVRRYCRLISPISLDCPPLSEARLLHDEAWLHEPLSIKATGVLLYGDDIRDEWPPPDFDAYLRNVTAVPVTRFSHLRNQPSPLTFPLAYPDPAGEFSGYDRPDAYAGTRSLKSWVHAVGFGATALLALQARQIVDRKEAWLPMYRQYIHDEWTDLLESIYHQGARQWLYWIPADPTERILLRDLCQRTLSFENHYLTRYRAYLLGELRSGEPARSLFAMRRLQEIHYLDQEVLSAVSNTQGICTT